METKYHSPRWLAKQLGWSYAKVLRHLRNGEINGIRVDEYVWIIPVTECNRVMDQINEKIKTA